MAVPATVGQLRTKISDMLVGDYIIAQYSTAASGAVGTVSNLGVTSALAELPAASVAAPNGYFYFVKSAEGLLISDRVVQNSISFDTLNTGKVIQGLSWNEGNIIPTMTSNNTPNGVASASSVYSSDFEAWKAFNKQNGDAWLASSGTLTGWLSYDFAAPTTIRVYAITPQTGGLSRAPKNWTFEGWDGSQWVVLDTQVNQTGWADNVKKMYTISNPYSYTKYRLNVTANNGDASYLSLSEIDMMDKKIIIRSLTGGVAFADAQGNMSTVNVSDIYGAFPSNNEYDKFLVNFPADVVKAGSTLDDVFHHSGTGTWTQDTVILSLGANTSTYRTLRGGASKPTRFYNGLLSSDINAAYGFRPVLQYQE